MFFVENQIVYVSKHEVDDNTFDSPDFQYLGITKQEIEENNIQVIDAQRALVKCPHSTLNLLCTCPRPSVADLVLAYAAKKIAHHKEKLHIYSGHSIDADTYALLDAAKSFQKVPNEKAKKAMLTFEEIQKFGKSEAAQKRKRAEKYLQKLLLGFGTGKESQKPSTGEKERSELAEKKKEEVKNLILSNEVSADEEFVHPVTRRKRKKHFLEKRNPLGQEFDGYKFPSESDSSD